MCYKAKCAMMHAETQSLEYIPNGDNSKYIKEKGFDKVYFKFCTKEYSKIYTQEEPKNKSITFELSLPNICRQIQRNAENLYSSSSDKSKFADGVIIF